MRRLMRIGRAVAAAWRARREWRQARRDFRRLCADGYAPQVEFRVWLCDEGEWSDGRRFGLTGLSTVVPVTRSGRRYILDVLRDIERTCIRTVVEDRRSRR